MIEKIMINSSDFAYSKKVESEWDFQVALETIKNHIALQKVRRFEEAGRDGLEKDKADCDQQTFNRVERKGAG